ncbi:bacterioferritin [Methylococcus capsulatus]|jgi:bacterioferritin|uniref:bacterioferritin n=1 Tax=Methylococcus capsulatus TaxID=414 RepID=UPI001C531D9A|nr:bacterioferritin [Methylococcus capsulatus]QXP90724.1 bacterioferritin [Methylococcus capsulatus]
MQGQPEVITALNRLLAGELAAIDQYFIHAMMYRDWGFHALYEHTAHEMQEEQAHASALIRRILFLEGVPDVGARDPIHVGRNVPEMLRNDLGVEHAVIGHLREVIDLCEEKGDYETRRILQVLLDDTEEDHCLWLEIQLRLIESIGLENYLQSQTEERI